MNRQFVISVLVLLVLTMMLGYLVHGVLLFDDYNGLPNIMRTPEAANEKFGFMILAHTVLAVGLTWLYRLGREANKSWVSQGARFGIAIAMVSTIPMFMIYYVAQQTPEALAIKQIGFDSIAVVLVGMATAFLNR